MSAPTKPPVIPKGTKVRIAALPTVVATTELQLSAQERKFVLAFRNMKPVFQSMAADWVGSFGQGARPSLRLIIGGAK